MAKKKYINNQIKETQPEENHIQSKREKCSEEIKEADNKLNITGKNIFIWCRMLCGFWFFFWKPSLLWVPLHLPASYLGWPQSLLAITSLLISHLPSLGCTFSLPHLVLLAISTCPFYCLTPILLHTTCHYHEIGNICVSSVSPPKMYTVQGQGIIDWMLMFPHNS